MKKQLFEFWAWICSWLAVARTRSLLGLSLASLLLLSLAFQIPYTYRIGVGANSDRQFVSGGIYPAEKLDGQTFRWTRSRADILLPALTEGVWEIQLGADAWQPQSPALVQVFANRAPLFEFTGTGQWQVYTTTQLLRAGDNLLTIQAPTFRPDQTIRGSTDSRRLGIKLDSLVVAPADFGFKLPPFVEYVLPLTCIVLGVYITLAALQFPRAFVIGSALVLLAAAFWVSAFARQYLNAAWMRVSFVTVLVALALIVVGSVAAARLDKRLGLSTGLQTRRWLILIAVTAFVIKWLGVIYPQIDIPDFWFHVHRFEGVSAGQMFFTQEAREFLGLKTVYPPGFYLVLAPLGVAFRNPLLLMQFVPPLLQSLGVLVLFWGTRKSGLGEERALLAAFFYAFLPITYMLMAWGTYSNTFAQELFLWIVMVWLNLNWRTRPLVAFGLMTFLFLLLFVSHVSMTALQFVFWALALGALWLTQSLPKRTLFLTVGAFAVGLVLALGIYYSNFAAKFVADAEELGASRAAKTAEMAGSSSGVIAIVGAGLEDPKSGLVPVPVSSVSEWIAQGFGYGLRELWVYYWFVPALLALPGAWLLYRDASTRKLALCVTASFGVLFLFFLVGLFFNLYTRYMLFVLPFVSLGAGVSLAWLKQQTWGGRRAVVAFALLVAAATMWFWIGRILY